ncbi:hypothetical protein FRC10_007148, partial [Ceratobasidium sp. 414]
MAQRLALDALGEDPSEDLDNDLDKDLNGGIDDDCDIGPDMGGNGLAVGNEEAVEPAVDMELDDLGQSVANLALGEDGLGVNVRL